ncbi:MAG: NAD-dependent epimerase/dehydratase family protein [Candidatus Aenigmarchaeota archaeon]|nr:NAD-dependent epimerase/dehydratase family protein [Candidatus Aenigmarchaeota archaeon]
MILLTGASGFVGRQLLVDLLAAGHPVRALVRDPAGLSVKGVEAVKGDVTDPASLKPAFRDVDTVIHLAGAISYRLPAAELMRVNLDGTRNVLAAAERCKKILFASSVSVYGETRGEASEATPPAPKTAYGRSKLAAEQAVLAAGIPALAYRISVVYGPGSPIWTRILKLFGKGFPIPRAQVNTNLIHVRDVSRAFLVGLRKGAGVYNIAGDRSLPFEELATKLAACFHMAPRFAPVWLVSMLAAAKPGLRQELQAFLTNREYAVAKARADLGFSPRMDLDTGLQEMVSWFQSQAKEDA